MISKRLTQLVIAAVLFSAAPAISAKTMYIDDMLLAPLRSGQGLQYRIVNKGLKSGTRVELIQDNPDSGYSLVQAPDGTKGWLPTRYLTDQPIAADRLARVTAELEKARSSVKELQDKLKQATQSRDTYNQSNQELQSKLARVTQELDHVRSISDNALTLDKRNKEFRKPIRSCITRWKCWQPRTTVSKASGNPTSC